MRKHLWSVSAFALLAAFASEAQAQTATPPVADDGDAAAAVPAGDQDSRQATQSYPGDIVVTASKRAENLSDVPMSITAISGDSLREKGITDIQGLVKVTPGLSYTDSGQGTPVFSLRGVGFFETSIGARPTVSVYTDEVPLPFSVMAQGAAFDLERVEVLKGPQGTLFGSNSTGGAINYIAAKPRSEEHTSELQSLIRISYAVFCLKNKQHQSITTT